MLWLYGYKFIWCIGWCMWYWRSINFYSRVRFPRSTFFRQPYDCPWHETIECCRLVMRDVEYISVPLGVSSAGCMNVIRGPTSILSGVLSQKYVVIHDLVCALSPSSVCVQAHTWVTRPPRGVLIHTGSMISRPVCAVCPPVYVCRPLRG